MEKLEAVETARAVFIEGLEWSVMRWLMEKKRVRELADKATAALDSAENHIKAQWSEDLKAAYSELDVSPEDDEDPFASAEREFIGQNTTAIPEHIRSLAKRVKDADDAAYRVRMAAEDSFAKAERRLSLALTKVGAEEAMKSYDLYYAAIDEAEAARVAAAQKP